MSFETLSIERRGPVATVWLGRPERRNALNGTALREIVRAFEGGDTGIDAVFSLCPGPLPLENAVANAAAYLADTTEQVIRVYLSAQKFRKRHQKC